MKEIFCRRVARQRGQHPSETMHRELMFERIRTLLAILVLVLAAGRTASALTINLTYDTDAKLTAAGLTAQNIIDMKAACSFAAKQFTDRYTDPINVNIMVTATPGTSDLGSSTTFFDTVDSYNNLRAAFAADSKTADDATTVGNGGSLAAGADPIATAHIYNVTRAQAKALALRADDMQNDGTFNFGGGQKWTYDPNNRQVAGKFDFIGVAMHEYSEIMGRNSIMGDPKFGAGTPNYCAFDLFHYTGAGTRGLNSGPGRSFSFNNGTSLLIAFNDGGNGGDLQDWAGPAPDSFNAAGPPNEQDDLTPVDLQTMDVIGYDRGAVAPGLVANVSTRLPVGKGDDVLIEGFTVQGPAGSTKKIIVRAIGPFLATCCGITDALANPTLEIHDSNNNNAIVAMNDDWKVTQVGGLITGDQSAEIAASGVKPGNDLESAIIANLPPGSYTAVVRGAGNSVGTGVVDAYDLSPASSATLVNFATRGLIQPADKLMIAGFIIQNGPVRAVIRAIGPSLAAFGITNALPDTTLQLRDTNGAIVVENDNWKTRTNGTSQQAEMEATQLQPTNDLEAAFVTTIQPGQYTAQVRGKPESTGYRRGSGLLPPVS
jgi:hypothetical protein